MPLEGHPADCACCTVRLERAGPGRKRAREDADLGTFLPEEPAPAPAPAPDGEGGEEEGEGEEDPEDPEDPEAAHEGLLINEALFKSFEAHVERLDAARLRRIEALSFKSALEDDGKEEVNQDATQDEIEGLGVWLPGDEFQGDVNYRTLQKLLTRVDQRGFERCAAAPTPRIFCALHSRSAPPHQVGAAVGIPRGLHEGGRARHLPRQLGDGAPGHHEALRLGDEQLGSFDQAHARAQTRDRLKPCNSRARCCVRSTPRRFGKTFSCARCAPDARPMRALTAPVCLAASPSFARASRSRSASRSVRHGDARIGAPAPACAFAHATAPSPQSSSRPRDARRASYLSGSLSEPRPVKHRGVRARRSPARRSPAPASRARAAGLSDWPVARTASASTTRRPVG